jgi:hypothetical protein
MLSGKDGRSLPDGLTVKKLLWRQDTKGHGRGTSEQSSRNFGLRISSFSRETTAKRLNGTRSDTATQLTDDLADAPRPPHIEGSK